MAEEITLKQIWFGIFLVVLLIGGYIGADLLLENLNKKETINNVDQIKNDVIDIKKSISPYEYKNSLKKIEIVSNFKNTTKNGLPVTDIREKIKINGSLKQGYVYVRASVDNGKKLTKNDDIYLKIGGQLNGGHKEIGGHLIAEKSLEVPSSEKYTEILFNLSDVKYKESYLDKTDEVISGDWLNFLNKGNIDFILAFSSTAREGNIEEISFYYECNNADCSVSLIK
ncbi:MAG: hypothetical protein WC472_01675 [Candidatus Paceibacterota bacterium]